MAAQQSNFRTLDRSQRESSPSSTVAYTTSMAVLDDKRPLKTADRLSMRVLEDGKAPVSLTVTDSGEMEVPLIGRVQARGRTCRELAYAIKTLLEREYYYKATVIVGLDEAGAKSPGRIYIIGQVRNQGPQDIPPDETFTVSKAILRAGGFADFANRKKVKLVRKTGSSSESRIVNVDLVINKGRTDLDPVVAADDTIIVPERMINF
jgi:polysaccharide export outer membrane protein